jgi:diguanylate cyclase (GGDEF)-like protein
MDQLDKKLSGKMEQSSIVLADIDYFKNINDIYGHPIGDIALQKVSIILMKHMREGDLAVRWGGEEFLLYYSDTSLEEAYDLTERIRKDIEKMTLQIKEIDLCITASFGIALLKNDGKNSFNISYKEADTTLYQAKAQGRNRVVYRIQNQ